MGVAVQSVAGEYPACERRQAVRVPCGFTTLNKGKITDISRTGAHLETREDFDLQQKITLNFFLPDGKPTYIDATVRRKHPTQIQSMKGYGLDFDFKENPFALNDITAFIEKRLISHQFVQKKPETQQTKLREVVVTGMGVLTSIGMNAEEYWQNLLKGKVGIKKVEDPFVENGELYLAPINDFKLEDFQDEKYYMRLRELNAARKKCYIGREVDLQLAVTAQAIKDARLEYSRKDNNVGIILGFETPGFTCYERGYLKLIEHTRKNLNDSDKEIAFNFFKENMFSYINAYTYAPLFYATSAFGFHGPSVSLNNASASGLIATHQAYRTIQTGEANIMLACAVEDLQHSSLRYHAFRRLGIHTSEGEVLPWDKNRKGMIKGEAAISLILEEKSHAIERGAKIYGEIKSFSVNQDSYHIFSPNLSVEYLPIAYQESLADAELTPHDIDLILPHSTATALNDQIQTDAIRKCFPHQPYTTSFTPQVGHPLGASGLLRVVTGLLSMRDQVIPPTLNCKEMDPNCSVNIVNNATQSKIRNVSCSAISYGGTNAALVLSPIQ